MYGSKGDNIYFLLKTNNEAKLKVSLIVHQKQVEVICFNQIWEMIMNNVRTKKAFSHCKQTMFMSLY